MNSEHDVFDPNEVGGGSLAPPPGVPQDGTALRRMQDSRGFATAIAVQQPRDLARVEKNAMYEAARLGERGFYGWGVGDDRIEGPSTKLAHRLAACWGNTAIDYPPIQELDDAWVFFAAFIDLEQGFTLTRPFRQSKKWKVYGRHDAERKDDIRFEIGASKAARNVILNALPEWLIAAAMKQCKAAVRDKIDAYIKSNGLAAAQKLALDYLKKVGVTEERVLAKFKRSAVAGLTADDLVIIRTDLVAINDGAESPAVLYPKGNGDVDAPAESKADIREKLTKKDGNGAGAPGASQPTPQGAEARTEDENEPTAPLTMTSAELVAMRDTIRSKYAALAADAKAAFLKNVGLPAIAELTGVTEAGELISIMDAVKSA